MTAVPMSGSASLADARQFVQANLDDGAHCPACGQMAKVYRRQIHAAMAQALIILYRFEAANPGEWAHLPTVLQRKQGDDAKLRYWDLIEEAAEQREDGGRAGYWRITDRGRRFVRGEIRVPKYALVYDSAFLGFDDDQTVDIRDALGTRFRYDDLMAGV